MVTGQPNRLIVTFDEEGSDEHSVPVDGFAVALEGLQDAVRLMVEHLGGREPGPGRPPTWVRDQSALRLVAVGPGSFAATLTLQPPPDGQAYLENFGPRALDALLGWDGREDSTLPNSVAEKLFDMTFALPDAMRLWLGGVNEQRKVEIKRVERDEASAPVTEHALLSGWLKEVNWDRLTAQLHDSTGGYVRLRFDAELYDAMRRLATEFVEVRGPGRFNPRDEWTGIRVERIKETRSWREPFELEGALHDPKPFDPEHVITASEPFDVDEFVRIIHEGRDVGREESSEWSS